MGTRLTNGGSQSDPSVPDVYFSDRYVRLHCPSDGEVETFHFQSGDKHFHMNIIRRPVPALYGCSGWFDFETPYGYGGPLATSTDESFLFAAWNAFSEYCASKKIFAGFIRFHPLLNTHQFAEPRHVSVVDDRETVWLDLNQNAEQVEANYVSAHRGAIRKAIRSGISVSRAHGQDALLAFANIYHARMREIGAGEEYLFGERYFQEIDQFGPDGYRLYLAHQNDTVIGGALILTHGPFAHYHLAASNGAYAKLAPSNLICDHMIKDLLESHHEILHFGGGLTNMPKDGLFKFKAGFSPSRALFRFGKFTSNKEIYDQICARWHEAHPDKAEKYGKYFLRYRY